MDEKAHYECTSCGHEWWDVADMAWQAQCELCDGDDVTVTKAGEEVG